MALTPKQKGLLVIIVFFIILLLPVTYGLIREHWHKDAGVKSDTSAIAPVNK